MEVDYKIKGIFKGDPQKCYEELPDVVTPENIVEVARDPSTELHKNFDWDNDSAAEKWRLHQARQFIQLLVIKTEKKEAVKPRVFQITSKKNVYNKVTFFVQHKDEYSKLLERARFELIGIKNRYKEISELEEVFLAIDNFTN